MASTATSTSDLEDDSTENAKEHDEKDTVIKLDLTGGEDSCSNASMTTIETMQVEVDRTETDPQQPGCVKQRVGRSGSGSASLQLKKLSLDENGTFMIDFDPERSKREMRKLNRKIHKETKKQNQMYDETGRLLENSLDMCDCLDADCPGCHFPCPKCGSEKCGVECRCGRRWTYEQVEVEGTNQVFRWQASS